jgi:hypothetical protein
VTRTAIRTAILPYCLLVILLQDLTLCRLNRDPSFVERSEVIHYLTCWIADKESFSKGLDSRSCWFSFRFFFSSQPGVLRRKRTKKK